MAEFNADGTIRQRWIPGPEIDRPVAEITVGSANSLALFHADRRGSTVAMSSLAGGKLDGPIAYDAYGADNGAGATEILYTGRRLDPDTGLYYYRARYYHTGLGRFLQTDPVGYEAGPYLYVYVENNPVNEDDPTGECALPHCSEDMQQERDKAKGNIGDQAKGFAAGLMNGIYNSLPQGINAQLQADLPIPSNPAGALGAAEGAAAAVVVTIAEPSPEGEASAIGQVVTKASKVEKSVTERLIGGKYLEKTKVIPGRGPGQSRAEIRTVKNPQGRTIRSSKDSYDRAGIWQHRKPLRGGPEGRPSGDF